MSDEYETRLRIAEKEAATALLQIGNHENICAERYAAIAKGHEETKSALAMNQSETRASFDKIYTLLTRVGILLIVGMAGILSKLVFFR